MSSLQVGSTTATSFEPGKIAPQRQRLLLADDDELMRELLSGILDWFGYRVDTAQDGAEAWEKIKAARDTRDPYTLLITDNVMPKLSGIGLAEKVRDANLPLPIIMVCGNQPENTTKVPISAVLLKPFTGDVLAQTVQSVLAKAGSEQETQPAHPSLPDSDSPRQTKL
jgi:CheY-like chemotaxis protein